MSLPWFSIAILRWQTVAARSTLKHLRQILTSFHKISKYRLSKHYWIITVTQLLDIITTMSRLLDFKNQMIVSILLWENHNNHSVVMNTFWCKSLCYVFEKLSPLMQWGQLLQYIQWLLQQYKIPGLWYTFACTWMLLTCPSTVCLSQA